jgi:hypothetical protein
MVWTPVLPKANHIGALSAHLRRWRSTAIDPERAFETGPMNGPIAQIAVVADGLAKAPSTRLPQVRCRPGAEGRSRLQSSSQVIASAPPSRVDALKNIADGIARIAVSEPGVRSARSHPRAIDEVVGRVSYVARQ